MNFPTAAKTGLMIRDTRRRKPVPITRINDTIFS
jgi:hypothetical protein